MTLAFLLQAAPGPGGLGSTLTGFLPILFVFAIFYFILLAPMRKQQKKTKEMLAALKKGDEVMTSGGIRGTIRRIEEPWLSVQIAENVTVRMARSAVTGLIEEGQAPKEPAG
jgi:preprotein translocase subunit YajC